MSFLELHGVEKHPGAPAIMGIDLAVEKREFVVSSARSAAVSRPFAHDRRLTEIDAGSLRLTGATSPISPRASATCDGVPELRSIRT
jgi:hypothetical protein